MRQHTMPHKFALTFRDVEDYIRPFDGKQGFPVQKWIDEFEETAFLMEWDEIQKFIFAKKSLTGLAKLFIQGESGISSWKKLKEALRKEFEIQTCAADIHRLLGRRRKKKEESLQEYFLVMREIASRCDVDEQSVIQYVIDGIDDDSGTKLLLYGANEIREFKEKLRHYEKAYERTVQEHQSRFVKNYSQSTVKNKKEERFSSYKSSIEHGCYNCGGKDGHKSADCKFKNQGPKCFRCNKFGHIASRCSPKNDGAQTVAVLAATAVSNVKDMVEKYQPLKKDDTEIEMNVIMDNHLPTYSRPRCLDPAEKAIIGEQVKQSLEDGVIKPSVSEYASQVVVAREKDGSQRNLFSPAKEGKDSSEESISSESPSVTLKTNELSESSALAKELSDIRKALEEVKAEADVYRAERQEIEYSDRRLPHANGQVESINSTATSILAKLSMEEPVHRYKQVEAVQRAMNSTYWLGDIVVIKRTQFGPSIKVKKKFLGPYRIVKVKQNDTYEVIREGFHEEPKHTTTCAEFMKPWVNGDESSEADDMQDGRMWESDQEFSGFTNQEVESARKNLEQMSSPSMNSNCRQL